MSLHPLTNFEIQIYYQNEPKFNGIYSRTNLSKIKDGVYIINLDKYESIGTHWIALCFNAENVTFFNSFAVEHIAKEIRKLIENKSIITNIYRIQTYSSIMCGYFCIRFIDFILKGKRLLEYRSLFSPNEYKNNNNIILKNIFNRIYNHFHNVLRFFNVLANFPFTTSETMGDYYL